MINDKIFKKNNYKGFTLIETLLALTILASGLILLTSSWGGSFLRIRKAETAHEVATLIERKMAEIEVKYRGKPISEISEEESGDFGEQFKKYKWKINARDLTIPDMSSVLAAKDGGADSMTSMIVKQMTDQLSKSIKEVKLTIILSKPNKKENEKDLEYSVTTYFVDYDKEIAVPGLPGAPGGASQ